MQRSPTAPDRGHSVCKGPERRQQGIWVSFQGSCETESSGNRACLWVWQVARWAPGWHIPDSGRGLLGKE